MYTFIFHAFISFITHLFSRQKYVHIHSHLVHKNTSYSNAIASNIPTDLDFKTRGIIVSPYSQYLAHREINRRRFKSTFSFKTRHVIESSYDGQSLIVDEIKSLHNTTKDDVRHTAILITHGIAGNSEESYMYVWGSIAASLNTHAFIYNRRGHVYELDHKSKLAPTWTNNNDMDDVVTFLKYVQGYKNIIAIGYSAGGPHMLSYAARHHDAFSHVFTISTALDFIVMSDYLNTQNKQVNKLLGSLYKNVLSKCNVPITHTHGYITEQDIVVAKYMGYPTVYEYYLASQPTSYMKYIKTPTICIISKDDDILCRETERFLMHATQENEHILGIITDKGGHIGWVTHDWKLWAEEHVIFNYLKKTLDDVQQE